MNTLELQYNLLKACHGKNCIEISIPDGFEITMLQNRILLYPKPPEENFQILESPPPLRKFYESKQYPSDASSDTCDASSETSD